LSFRKPTLMKKHHYIPLALLLLCIVGVASAQDDSSQAPADSAQQPATPPAPAYGQEPATPNISQGPPLTSLDEASLEPNLAARSFLAPNVTVAQFADTNATSALGGKRSWTGVTHLQGSLALQRLWSRYETSFQYAVGGTFYNKSVSASQVHHLYFNQRFLWRTGAFELRDTASYLPEGSFGFGSFGGSSLGGGVGLGGGGSFGGGVGGVGGFPGLGGSTFGGVGNVPRLNNLAMAEIQQSLSPRSSVTLAGGYGILHFTGNSPGLIDSRQVNGQAGYNYTLSRRSTIGTMYMYRAFSFPNQGGGSFQTHMVHLVYGYQLTGRLNLVLSGGPQFIRFSSLVNSSRHEISGSGRAMLKYRLSERTSMSLNYNHFTSSGSGFFAGAQTDLVRLNATRQMGRLWTLTADVGYTHNHRLQPSTAGANSVNYNSGYGGLRIARILRRTLSAYAFYNYNDIFFSNSVCVAGTSNCGRSSNRNIVGLGLDWHPQPIRID
jgi:hypothetical protein